MGLLSFPDVERESIRRGVRYLVGTQNQDGSWDEDLITGTGFPRVFYLKYDMYRNNWPLLALAMYANRLLAPVPTLGLRQLEAPADDSVVPAIASLFASLPGMDTLRELLAKLNHG